MLIGYVRVSKSDGTQTLAPQRDAMLAAGVICLTHRAPGRMVSRPSHSPCARSPTVCVGHPPQSQSTCPGNHP